jgi:hypothetical protein
MHRFMLVAAVVLASLVCGRTAAGGTADAAAAGERPRESRTFVLEPGQTKIELARSFLVPASDTVTVDGVPLARGEGYRINTLRGSIVLVKPAAGGERLVVRFSRYPLPFSPLFASHVSGGPSPEPLEPLAPPARGGAQTAPAEPYQLRLSGSKTVGVNVGTGRDLGLDQSLRVTMVGKVAKDLEVNAFLSDDNLPVQPEGNTEELKYLDKVYVQVKAKHTEVQLGDFTSALSWSQFSAYRRELRGVSASLAARGETFFAGGGVAKGRFKTANITGREGVQGPYELLPPRRFNAVVILSGTERVYFNGRLLKRGGENDYTIDYNRGTVTFTERVSVTDDSEIVIDYEMSEDNYERSTVSGGWTSPRLAGALTLRAFFFQESDDTDKPVSGALTAEERSVLAEAGNDSSKAFTSGITKVDAGKGDYAFVGPDSLPGHYVYVGTGGDYALEFYEVGSGAGDYLVDGFTATGGIKYRYAGVGKGDFRIGRFLPLPERTRLFTLGASAAKGALFLDAEGDVSVHDRNLLSSIGDGDNAGSAMKVTGGLKDLVVPAARLTLSGELSTLDSRFASPDKARESYFYRDWGLEGIALTGRETIGGGSLALAGARAWNLEGSYLALSRGAALSARKAEASAAVGNADTRGLALKGFDSNAGSGLERRFLQGSGVYSVWRLVPRLTLETERYKVFGEAAPDTGRYYTQGAFTVAGRSIGPYRASLGYTRRLTDDVDSTGTRWFRSRESDEIDFDGGFSRGPRIIELLATHRLNRDVPSSATDRYNLARIRARDAWEKAGIAADVSYRLSAGEERTQERAVIFVGANQGDYDQQGNEVGQKRGDYMLLYLPGGDTEPVRTVELSMQVSAGAGVRGIGVERGGEGLFGLLSREVSLDHSFSVLEKSRTGDLTGLYLLRPSLLQRNDVTVYGINRLREECTLFNTSRIFKLRLSYSREDEEDNRLENAFAESFVRDVRARIESVPWEAFAMTWEVGEGLRTREAEGPSQQNYRVETGSLSQVLTYRIGHSTRVSFELSAERRDDRVSAARQTSYVGAPSVTSSIGERLNVSSSFRLTYTDVQSSGGQPLFFLEQGLREDWSGIAQYRVSRNVSFGLNYTGRREKDYTGEVRTVHDLKVESRAYF